MHEVRKGNTFHQTSNVLDSVCNQTSAPLCLYLIPKIDQDLAFSLINPGLHYMLGWLFSTPRCTADLRGVHMYFLSTMPSSIIPMASSSSLLISLLSTCKITEFFNDYMSEIPLHVLNRALELIFPRVSCVPSTSSTSFEEVPVFLVQARNLLKSFLCS